MHQELARPPHFDPDVVVTRLGPNSDLLDFDLMSVGAMLPFLLLILELAKVHDPADGRPFAGSDLHKIQPRSSSLRYRFVDGQDS